MSEPKLISPMLDNFSIGEAISNHHGIACYPAMPNDSDSRYIVKIISIPASQVQLQALLLTGAYQSEDSAREYFHDLAKGIVAETEILTKLSKLEGFLPFEGCQIVPKEGEVGYDVYLLSSYKRTLARHLRRSNLSHLAAINLGLDLCASLAVARQCGYLCTNIKPENIFISDDKEYRIGDLGFLRLDALKYASLPDRSIGPYTAPEVVDAYSDVNATLDIYAAGMILYQIYNGGELPFQDRAPSEPLPPPAYADYELAEIILMACAPNPADRWQDPIAMGQALVAYMQRNSVNDTPIIVSVEDHTSEVPLAAVETGAQKSEHEEDVAETEIADEDESTVALYSEQEESPDQLQLDQFTQLFGDDEDTAVSPNIDFSMPSEEDTTVVQAIASEEEAPQEIFEDEEITNLSFMEDMVSDDTAPSEEMVPDFSYETISDDTSRILAEAEDLLLHETPAGVVAPEAIDIDTIIPEPASAISEETMQVNLDEVGMAAVLAVENTSQETKLVKDIPSGLLATLPQDHETPEDLKDTEEDMSEDVDDESSNEESQEEYDLVARRSNHRRQIAKKKARRSKIVRRWVVLLLVLLLLGGLAFGGYLFYKDYYLCSVISLVPSGEEDRLVVTVTADIDESLLTVHCIDTHGNSLSSPVENGRATFSGLTPNTLYSLKVEVSGLHKLTGETAESYTTPLQTEIVTFSAVTGTEPGSAILTFTIDGMDSDTWTLTYSAEGLEEKKQIFSGHMVTVKDLVAGMNYTFKLDSVSNLYIIGCDTMEYTAMDPVFAENLVITGCTKDSLDVHWNTPEGAVVESWTVRCYSDTGYDQTVETTIPYVTFKGLNGNEAHTVEVVAKGMSAGSRCYMTANAVTVTDITAEKVDVNQLKLTWNFQGNTPASAWILTYTVDGSVQGNLVKADTNSTIISPLIPGGTYTLKVELEDGTTVFSLPLTVTLDEAPRFSNYFTGADHITARMCNTPTKANWSHTDLKESDYTDTFKVGTKASFLLYTKRNYDTSKDLITTMFVIHDSNGNLVSSNIVQNRWVDMWYKRYCELDIPALPDAPGTYSIAIYFNGAFVHSQNFTVTE